MVERMLASVATEALIAECRRRGIEVAAMLDYEGIRTLAKEIEGAGARTCWRWPPSNDPFYVDVAHSAKRPR